MCGFIAAGQALTGGTAGQEEAERGGLDASHVILNKIAIPEVGFAEMRRVSCRCGAGTRRTVRLVAFDGECEAMPGWTPSARRWPRSPCRQSSRSRSYAGRRARRGQAAPPAGARWLCRTTRRPGTRPHEELRWEDVGLSGVPEERVVNQALRGTRSGARPRSTWSAAGNSSRRPSRSVERAAAARCGWAGAGGIRLGGSGRIPCRPRLRPRGGAARLARATPRHRNS